MDALKLSDPFGPGGGWGGGGGGEGGEEEEDPFQWWGPPGSGAFITPGPKWQKFTEKTGAVLAIAVIILALATSSRK